MRSDAPTLLPILRSRHLAEILTLILLHPDVEYTLSDVAAKLSLPLTTVQREVTRLSTSELIREQASAAEAAETLKTAAEIIDSAARLLPNLGFF